MARYIDRDTAIKTAIEMCVKVVGHDITQIDAVDIAQAFEDIPIADVVPKSEVDRLNKELELVRLEYAGYEAGVKHGIKMFKSKVAREIFEEIEKIIQYSYYVDELGEWHDETLLLGGIDELKKKYTEG